MTVKELKEIKGYEFECNLEQHYKYMQTDEWGSAFIWVDDFGAEYNFCIDGTVNSCAIYKTQINPETEYVEIDYDTFIHYEIDFDDLSWKKKLENAMCEAVIKFFYE